MASAQVNPVRLKTLKFVSRFGPVWSPLRTSPDLPRATQMESVKYWTLNVTVLRAQSQISYDYFSKSDFYVTLTLPTATTRTQRTKTISNNNEPEWNETFSFRVPSQVKNILEIKLFDEDTLSQDDLVFTGQLDLATLDEGSKQTKIFTIVPNTKDVLEMEFELLPSEYELLENHSNTELMMESVTYWTVNVTVLRARSQTSHDYWSKSDFYVTLTLPTATARTRRTQTISNNNEPEWNETFSFRVPCQVKNILEIKLFDEDVLSRDDLISTVLLDLATLEVGSKETKTFTIVPETEDVLEMEFELLPSEDEVLEYASNGILMAAPLSVLNVNVEKLQHNPCVKSCAATLRLCGAYQETQSLQPKLKRKLQFHVNRELETELGLTALEVKNKKKKTEVLLSAVPLQPLPPQLSAFVSLPLGKETVDLHLESCESPKEDLRVRLGFDLPPQEKDFLQKRRRVVAKALQGLLGLESGITEEQVPRIALVASGGGARAMTGFLGSLKGLKEAGLLDTVTYMTGVSGSTWAMSTLCQNEDWSQNLETVVSRARAQMTKRTVSAFSYEKMKYYSAEMEQKQKQGHLVSYIDMAGLILEHLVFGQKNNSTLSEQQKTVKDGQNPLPIYTAVNAKEAVDGRQSEAEWCEFTPFEVGLQKYGAFVRAVDFGSEFFLGHLIKKLPEIRLPYLMGIWSSVFSLNLHSLLKVVTGNEPQWTPEQADVENIEEGKKSSKLNTSILCPSSSLSGMFSGLFKNRPIIAELYNFTRGLFLHQDYSRHSNFLSWKESHPDAFPNQLTPSDSTLRLIDSGHSINVGCVPVLRPEREVDLILVLSYSWEPQHLLNVVEKTVKYCEDHKIPFPKADLKVLEQQPPQEVYVFEDQDQPLAPIVVHLPLVNVSYREYKAPGVKRETAAEKAAGLIDVSSAKSPFTTKHMTYSTSDFDALIDLTHYNLLNNRDTLLSSINRAVERRLRK